MEASGMKSPRERVKALAPQILKLNSHPLVPADVKTIISELLVVLMDWADRIENLERARDDNRNG